MPENHDFEKAMQQQLDGFQVTPSPSDWQAVYEQLHPTKKRRPIWWWIPAMLMILALGWYISKEPNGTAQQATPNTAQQSISSKPMADQTKASNPQVSATTTTPATVENEKGTKEASYKKNQTTTGSNIETATAQEKISIETDAATKNATAKTSISKKRKNGNRTSSKSNTIFTNQNAAFIEPQSGEQIVFNNTAANTFSNDVTKEPAYNLGLLQKTFSSKNITLNATLPGPIPLKKMEENPEAKKANSTNRPPSKWQWGLYAGIGANRLTEPIGLLKAQADLSSNNPGSSRVVTTSTEQNGWHYNAGFFVNRKWNRNWQFSTGLGVNVSTWANSSTTYLDSLLPAGSVFSRQLVSTVEQSNKMWMIELPIQISNRIAGKSAGTFWWTAGINNQFLLTLKQQTNSSTVQNNFATTSDEKSLTSGVNKYQPQLRAGFIYDYTGKKSHWQLVPLLHIGLVKPLQSGDFNLMNMQLQGRWFFGRQ